MPFVEPRFPLQPAPGDDLPRQIGLLTGDYSRRMLMAAGLAQGHQFHALDPEGRGPHGMDLPIDLVLCDAPDMSLNQLESLHRRCPLYPGLPALRLGKDRLEQRRLLERLDFPTYPLLSVETRSELREARARLQCPAVLKPRDPSGTRRSAILDSEADLEEAWLLLGGEPLVLEPLLPVHQELVLTAVRSLTGEIAYYPLTERHPQRPDLWVAPAAAAETFQTEAASLAGRVLRELNLVGVLALRFFVTERSLVAAEITPGFHPAGYWTVEGAYTSHYENALRAVLGQPLGPVQPRGHTATLGLSYAAARVPQLLEVAGAQLHYHAREAGSGFCRGHVTLQSDHLDRLHQRVEAIAAAVRSS